MPTFEDVKITEDMIAKPLAHMPVGELHVKVFESDPAVSNYRANDDGTQTWDYQIQTGELVECTEMFAHYYGQSDNSYYEVTGPSGWRL